MYFFIHSPLISVEKKERDFFLFIFFLMFFFIWNEFADQRNASMWILRDNVRFSVGAEKNTNQIYERPHLIFNYVPSLVRNSKNWVIKLIVFHLCVSSSTLGSSIFVRNARSGHTLLLASCIQPTKTMVAYKEIVKLKLLLMQMKID